METILKLISEALQENLETVVLMLILLHAEPVRSYASANEGHHDLKRFHYNHRSHRGADRMGN